jgi:hypothetical protein
MDRKGLWVIVISIPAAGQHPRGPVRCQAQSRPRPNAAFAYSSGNTESSPRAVKTMVERAGPKTMAAPVPKKE